MAARKILASEAFSSPIHFLALGFGAGLAPKAPGTFGTLVAIPVFLLAQFLSWPLYLILLVVGFVVGVYLCDVTAKNLGVDDHPGIVWDEIIGFLVCMFGLPVTWQWILAGFVAFRFFDILKPWPISYLDKNFSGGFGIMIDDLLAGIFAAVLLQVFYRVL